MAIKCFEIEFSELAKIQSLFLTTRIRSYHSGNEVNLMPFSFFIKDEKFSLGQIKKEDYENCGTYPVIDQGQDYIAGYSDEEGLVYSGKLPVIVFGDHTRIFKYVDFRFIQGADGIKVIQPNENKVNSKFFYYLLRKVGVADRGYNRHFSILKKAKYPALEKPIQDQIVAQIEPIEQKIKDLKNQIKKPQEVINQVFAREFGFNMKRFEELSKEKFFHADLTSVIKNQELRFSVKHSLYSLSLIKILNNGSFLKFGKLLLEQPQYGANESGKDYSDGDVRYLRITDIDDIGKVLDNDVKTAERVETKYLLKNNDFLFARSGNTVGKSFLYNSEIHEKAIFAGYFIKFVFDTSKLEPLFLLYHSKSFLFEVWKNSVVRTMGQPNINAEEYKTLPIPNIPLLRQRKIVDEIKLELDAQEKIKKQIEAERQKIDAIIEQSISS
jgi:restriction endonuclease S subunit